MGVPGGEKGSMSICWGPKVHHSFFLLPSPISTSITGASGLRVLIFWSCSSVGSPTETTGTGSACTALNRQSQCAAHNRCTNIVTRFSCKSIIGCLCDLQNRHAAFEDMQLLKTCCLSLCARSLRLLPLSMTHPRVLGCVCAARASMTSTILITTSTSDWVRTEQLVQQT